MRSCFLFVNGGDGFLGFEYAVNGVVDQKVGAERDREFNAFGSDGTGYWRTAQKGTEDNRDRRQIERREGNECNGIF